jgi:ubiquitin-protein ligase
MKNLLGYATVSRSGKICLFVIENEWHKNQALENRSVLLTIKDASMPSKSVHAMNKREHENRTFIDDNRWRPSGLRP